MRAYVPEIVQDHGSFGSSGTGLLPTSVAGLVRRRCSRGNSGAEPNQSLSQSPRPMGPAERKRGTDMKHAAMEQNTATSALNDSGLNQVSGGGSISDMKAEAAAKYDNAMSAAT